MRRSIYDSARERVNPWYIVLGVVSVGILITFIVLGQREGLRVDSANCLQDDAPPAQVVVLFDPSDSLSMVQRRSVASRLIEDLESSMPERTEIRLYTIARAGRREPVPEMRVCVPPHPDSIGTLESFRRNRTILQREYSMRFRDPLQERLNALLDVPSDSISPIVEAMQTAVVDAFQPRGASIPRHVIVVSDMVQNSSDLSFFRQTPDFGTFARNPDYDTLRVDLNGVRVTVFLLARRGIAGRLQGEQLRGFWEDYFLDLGAEEGARPRWVPIEG